MLLLSSPTPDADMLRVRLGVDSSPLSEDDVSAHGEEYFPLHFRTNPSAAW